MTADRDLTRTVRAWLRTDEHESADRVLDEVMSRLESTPQHRSWWPARRVADLDAAGKLVLAVAAVVIVAVVGINLLPSRGGIGPGGPEVTPSPSPSPTATPSATRPPSPEATSLVPRVGELAVGRHGFSQNGVDFSLDFPAGGWISSGLAVPPDGVHVSKGILPAPTAAWLLVWSIDGVYADPCGHVAGPPLSPSAADLASAVAALPGAELVSAPSDVTLGGRPAKHVEISIPEDIDCEPFDYWLWYDSAGCDANPRCERWVTALGETNMVWIFEIDGKHIWIEAETYAGVAPELEQEVRQIVESIQFE